MNTKHISLFQISLYKERVVELIYGSRKSFMHWKTLVGCFSILISSFIAKIGWSVLNVKNWWKEMWWMVLVLSITCFIITNLSRTTFQCNGCSRLSFSSVYLFHFGRKCMGSASAFKKTSKIERIKRFGWILSPQVLNGQRRAFVVQSALRGGISSLIFSRYIWSIWDWEPN